jgi:hypothetical protein
MKVILIAALVFVSCRPEAAPTTADRQAEALRLVDAGDLEGAERAYEGLAHACGAKMLAARHNALVLAWHRGERDWAEEEMRGLVRAGYAPAVLQLGIFELEKGCAAGALYWIRQAEGDPDQRPELADALHLARRHGEAAIVYGELLSDDPLSLYNLAAALHDDGKDVRSLVESVLASADEHDHTTLAAAIELLALTSPDPAEADRLYAEADWHRTWSDR